MPLSPGWVRKWWSCPHPSLKKVWKNLFLWDLPCSFLFHFFLYMVMLAYLIPDPESHLGAFHLFTSFNNNNGPFLRTSYMPGLSWIILLKAHIWWIQSVVYYYITQMRVSGFNVWSQTICGSRHLNPGHLNFRAWACCPLLHLFKAVSSSPSLLQHCPEIPLLSKPRVLAHREKPQSRKAVKA